MKSSIEYLLILSKFNWLILVTMHINPQSLVGCLLICLSTLQFAVAQNVTLEKKWETDTSLRIPESVYLDAKRNVLYVANIEGNSGEKDGKGFISRLTPEGKVVTLEWVSGLNAPKGMGVVKNRLYVADLTDVVVIDIDKGSIEQRIAVPDAVFLNDVTVDNKGVVYVSDTRKGRVHRLKDGQVSTLVEGRKSPNGLLALPASFYVLDDGAMYSLEKDNTLKKVVDLAPSVDGIVEVKPGQFIVSCWRGEVFYVDAKKGVASKLLDTQAEKLNTADIDYDPKKRLLYIPTFNGNKVAAYEVKGI
jgi:hypothetical protein